MAITRVYSSKQFATIFLELLYELKIPSKTVVFFANLVYTVYVVVLTNYFFNDNQCCRLCFCKIQLFYI